MELHDSLWCVAVRVVDVRELHVIVDSVVHLGNVNLTHVGKQKCSNIGIVSKTLDEPKTEKIIPPNTQMREERWKQHALSAETERSKFEEGIKSMQICGGNPGISAVSPKRDVHEEVVVVVATLLSTYTFITPSSVTRVLNPCSGAAVSSMPPSGEDEEKILS